MTYLGQRAWRRGLAAAITALLGGCAAVPPGPVAVASRPVAAPPTLVVAIAVDQFSADLFDEYRASFSGGLGRLAREGVVFSNGYQSHAATETCPGHSTILTGDNPARTGIIANEWYQPGSPRGRTSIYCAEDESRGDRQHYVVSPLHLRVPVLGDYMKSAIAGSRSVAVAGKDRAAIMMGGRTPDVRWYYDYSGKEGRFASDLTGATRSATVTAVNARLADQMERLQVGPMDVPADCAGRARAVSIDPGGRVVGDGRFAHGPGEKEYRYSPAIDRDTLDLADGLVDEQKLGQRGVTDLLAISLSATDYVGHRYGTEGQEMCLQLHALDIVLGRFLAGLDRRGIDYEVVLTADHGGTDTPERLQLGRDPSAHRVPATVDSKIIGAAIADRLHLADNPLVGNGDIYVMPGLDPATRARVLAAAAASYRASHDVSAVFTRDALLATPVPTGDPTRWTLRDRARASFDAERSGDLIVLFGHDVVPISKPDAYYVTTHGSAYDNDRRVPILFWRRGMAAASPGTPVRSIDIMPTLAATVGVSLTAGAVDGQCLRAVAGARCGRR